MEDEGRGEAIGVEGVFGKPSRRYAWRAREPFTALAAMTNEQGRGVIPIDEANGGCCSACVEHSGDGVHAADCQPLRAEAMVAWKELLASAPQYNLSARLHLASLLFSQVDDPKRGYGARKRRSQSIDAIMAPRRSPPDAALRSHGGGGSLLWSC